MTTREKSVCACVCGSDEKASIKSFCAFENSIALVNTVIPSQTVGFKCNKKNAIK